MNTIINWLTGKRIILISMVGFLLHLITRYRFEFGMCTTYRGQCDDFGKVVMTFTIIFIPVFVFALLNQLIKSKVFYSWRFFSFYFFLLYFVLVSTTPTSTHGLDFFPIVKWTVAVSLSVFYSLISLVLILYKSFKKD